MTFLSRLTVVLAAFAILVLFVPAKGRAQGFATKAPYAILLDYDSGTVLYEKAADTPFEPASMAKLGTAEYVFHELKEGSLSLDDEFTISEHAWRDGGAPSGGSTMYAEIHSRIAVRFLLRGLLIQSGNDAAIALAEGIAGSEAAFADRVTHRVAEIGLKSSRWENANGLYDPDQHVTARDLATLASYIISNYPEYYKIFSEPEFTWNNIRQMNRNPLLDDGIGVDGLKTGYIKESGYGITVSAKRNDQRLILVIAGLEFGGGPRPGSDEAARLGFSQLHQCHRLQEGRGGGAGVRLWRHCGRRAPEGAGRHPPAGPARRRRRLEGARDLPGPARRAGRGGAACRRLQGLERRAADPGGAALHGRVGGARTAAPACARCARPAALRLAVTAGGTLRGRFITLEGGEGAGKSTQMRHLAEWLQGQGIDVVTTREPGGSPKAEVLRELLLGGSVAPFGAEAEALVFALARADHVAQTIRPALQAGRWVISDRFFDSTRAYQGASGVSTARLSELEKIAVGDDRPDLTLILDLSVEEGMRRMGKRDAGPDRFERDDVAMHEARRAAFLAIAEREPERCAVIDASRGEAEVAEAIRAVVAERLQPARAGAG